jgi:peptidoglycan/xylan/chitin deacetylase (PgdA/CDA1 family)
LKPRAVATTGRRRLIRRGLAASFGLLVSCALIVVVQPLWAFDVLSLASPHILWRVKTTRPLVALSFDDGPAPDHTPDVLRILARHSARATFFLIGDRAEAHPELLRQIRAAGHEVGNHAFTLRSTLGLTEDEFSENLRQAESVLGLTNSPKLFRPPGGRIRDSHLARAESLGYRVVLGSAYPYDPAHPPSRYIRWLIAKNLAPGVIVILHDGIADPSRMMAALDGILVDGERKGLSFVPIGQLIKAGDD